MKKIFIAESEKHVSFALRLMIEIKTDNQVVGIANHPENVISQVCKKHPDVILLDWDLPGVHHERLLSAIRDCCPSGSIFATSNQPQDEEPARFLGVDTFILKISADQFITDFTLAMKNIYISIHQNEKDNGEEIE